MTILQECSFGFKPIKGTLVESGISSSINSVAGFVLSTSTNTLYGGTAVKLAGTSERAEFEKAAATDEIFGFVMVDMDSNKKVAKSPITVICSKNVMWMESNGAIANGDKVSIVVDGDKVEKATTNKIVGIAMSNTSAAGEDVRVMIMTPLFNQI